jgi:hypothetical protein
MTKKRDLPEILIKPIVKCSPVILHLNLWMKGVWKDLNGGVSIVVALNVFLHTLLHVSVAAKEALLSVTPSRFHSRQHWVDLVTLMVLVRSWKRGVERLFSSSSSPFIDSLLGPSAPSILLQHIDLICLELGAAILITHRKAMTIEQLKELVKNWDQAWNKPSASPASSSNNLIDFSSISQALDSLWNCAPFSMAREATGSALSFLSTFSTLPLLSGSTSPTSITQDFPLTCDASLVLRSPVFSIHISPTNLLRLVHLRHEMQVDDYPELLPEDEMQAGGLRSELERIGGKYPAII